MQALRHLRGSKEVDYFDTNRVRPAEIRPEGRLPLRFSPRIFLTNRMWLSTSIKTCTTVRIGDTSHSDNWQPRKILENRGRNITTTPPPGFLRAII